MPAVLTTGDALTCTVGGGTVEAQGARKLVVAGDAVLTEAGVMGRAVSACKPPGSPPPPPCTAVGSVAGGLARRLVAGGSPVLLSGTTASGALGAHPIGPAGAGQSKLVAT